MLSANLQGGSSRSAVSDTLKASGIKDVDGRDKPGHDDFCDASDGGTFPGHDLVFVVLDLFLLVR
jgi:hypothetical protein